MRKFLLSLPLLAAGIANAQKTPDPRPFANMITANDLKTHLYIVASKDRTVHPDLHPGATDEERRALEARFVELTAAYQSLVA